MRTPAPCALTIILVAALATAWPRPAGAEPRQPRAVAAAQVEPKLGTRVPVDLRFTDAQGRVVRLGDVLAPGDRPVMLLMAYASCELLCSVVLRAVTDAVPRMALQPGRDYQLVLVSIDSRESADVAARHQATLLARIGRPGRVGDWPYLVGDEAAIATLADAIGFGFAWDPGSQQYAHPAVVFVLTADGRVAATVQGLPLAPAEVEAALRRAARDEILPAEAAAVLRCFRFDSGRYTGVIQTSFRAGAAVIFTMLAAMLTALMVSERRRRRRA